MRTPVETLIAKVRRRWLVNLFLDQAALVLLIAGGVFGGAVLSHRLLAIGLNNRSYVNFFIGGTVIVVFVMWILRMPNRMEIAGTIDERLHLKDRVSSALALQYRRDDPFAQAAYLESQQTVSQARPDKHFPLRFHKLWVYTLSCWLAAGLAFMFLPQKDLLGFLKKQKQEKEQTRLVAAAKTRIKEVTASVESSIQQLNSSDLTEDMADLNSLEADAQPAEIKREAIRKLGDLNEKLKEMKNQTDMQAQMMMQQMLKQLKGSPDPLVHQLTQAMAQSQFDKASNIAGQLAQQLEKGELSEEQRRSLEEQLKTLAQQLDRLGEQNKELEGELDNLGLDKKLAHLDPGQLRQALKKQGLNPELIEKLMKKAQACQSAKNQCSKLGNCLNGMCAGGLSGKELAEMLDELEGLEEQLKHMKLSQAECEWAMQRLGQGMCKGLGCNAPGNKPGRGIGLNPGGDWMADESIGEAAKNDIQKTLSPSKTGEGAVIASWYFKGEQIRGEATREYGEVMQAARDNAAEAIEDKKIPKQYEKAVKEYFSEIENN